LPDLEGLLKRCDVVADEILRVAREGKKIAVVTHIDADGLASGATVFCALMRKGADVMLRTLPDLDRDGIAGLKEQKFDFYLFTDLGSTLVSDLEEALDGRFLLLDHHQLSPIDAEKQEVVNAWQYGFDGGREACASSMAYAFACAVDPGNRDLSYLAVVGAVADRQDSGQGRSLTGLNRFAVEQAQTGGLVSVSKDLLFTGRETRPVHESIALTSTPYLPGVTGGKDTVLAAMLQAGVRIREEGRWRTLSEFSSEEKMKLTEVIASLISDSGSATDALAGLIGEVYTLEFEDPFTPLRDAREFATLLNACGRMGESGLGLSVCLGDRREALRSALKTLADYRLSISKALESLQAQEARLEMHGDVVLVRAEGVVDEKLLGPVTSILTSSVRFKDKVVVAMTNSGESQLKVSCRTGDAYPKPVNLGTIMKDAADAVRGVGGGHNAAAGAKIPSPDADEFARIVLEKIAAA
jgi:single-stranded-DNA-specific exonuclease